MPFGCADPLASFISIDAGHMSVLLLGRLLVSVGFLPRRQFDFFPLDVLVRDQTQEMGDAVKARAAFVVRIDYVPGAISVWVAANISSRARE